MKLTGLLALVALLSTCGKAEEPEALAERESAEVAVRPALHIQPDGTMIMIRRELYDPEKDDLTEVERYLADQARRMPRKKDETLVGIELPDNPLLIKVDKASKQVWINGSSRSERKSMAEQFAAEYSKIASDQTAQPSSLTIPSKLSSPDFVFGLETRNSVLWLHTHTEPRLYTVTARDGEMLAEGIALDELEQRFPEFAGFERLGETDLIGY